MLRIILELNPPWPANVIVAVPEDPVWNIIEEIGLIEKSGSVEESQMLLSTIPKAKAASLLPYWEFEEKATETSRNMPDA